MYEHFVRVHMAAVPWCCVERLLPAVPVCFVCLELVEGSLKHHSCERRSSARSIGLGAHSPGRGAHLR